MKQYILALDQGTSSSRAVVFDSDFHIKGFAQQEFPQIYANDSWVEHDPEEIWKSQYYAALRAIRYASIRPQEIASIGITNQRETTILWDRKTGKPIYNAIVWMCRRTSDYCTRLKEEGYTEIIRQKTGLIPDSYFSATKIMWLLDHIPGAREKAEKGDLLFGTVDSWLLYRLSGGAHKTDYTNAARTMLFNIHSGRFDDDLLELLHIPASLLPEVLPSNSIFGYTQPSLFDGCSIPIGGIAGDQHAALLGHGCLAPGMAKNTYGTGCFLLMNTGTTPIISQKGLLTTIAFNLDSTSYYALEGSIFNAGSTVQWLRDELKILDSSAQSEALAASVPDTDGVYIVPAFSGLGAPYWDMYARGLMIGITRNTNRAHITRAVLESIAFQVHAVLQAMQEDSGCILEALEVDGGACANNLLMQFQADILNKQIIRPKNPEATALGAAFLAGLSSGILNSPADIASHSEVEAIFIPKMQEDQRNKLLFYWNKAVSRAAHWAEPLS